MDCQCSIRAVALFNPSDAIAKLQRNDCSIPPVEVSGEAAYAATGRLFSAYVQGKSFECIRCVEL